VREREAAFERVLETVRGVRLVLDAEMQGIARALTVLGTSSALRRRDFDAFRGNVDAFLTNYPDSAISVATRDGRQVFNSRLPPGVPAPPRAYTASIEEVFRTRQPAFSNLFVGSVSAQRLIIVSVPVIENDEVVFELAFNPPLQLFQRLITQQAPGQWTFSIFDRTGTNFARVPNPELTVGQKASPSLLPALLQREQAKLPTMSLEGVPLLTAFTRSNLTGWTVAAGTPVADIVAPLWRTLALTAAIGLVMLGIGLAFAVSMATRIARGETLLALMINELNHRVKNTLATVQSIAAQTFRSTPDPQDAMRKFDARLRALGEAHDVLSEEKWENADLRDIVLGAIEPFVGKDGQRARLSGPRMRLSPRSAVMTSLVLHELATNAAKYGALSNGSGRILIDWTTKQSRSGPMLWLQWRESGGPPVQPALQQGFGTRLIQEGFARQLGGSASLELKPDGLVCILECPIK
jgi:two-component sensor histidine kinase